MGCIESWFPGFGATWIEMLNVISEQDCMKASRSREEQSVVKNCGGHIYSLVEVGVRRIARVLGKMNEATACQKGS